MRLSEIAHLNGTPAIIEKSCRDELPDFFHEDLGFRVGAEIGVLKGEFTEKFCKAGLKMYAIDPWLAFPGQGRTQQKQDRQDFLYSHTQRVLAPYDCKIIRATSMDALKHFKDGSLDFVYIDGDHSFRYIAEDIYEWAKKVKRGGMVAGHDYYCTSPEAVNIVVNVKPVVDAYTKCFGINNWWIFGRSKPIELEARYDKVYSWMFFKK